MADIDVSNSTPCYITGPTEVVIEVTHWMQASDVLTALDLGHIVLAPGINEIRIKSKTRLIDSYLENERQRQAARSHAPAVSSLDSKKKGWLSWLKKLLKW